jgi:hypothetical protein
MFLNCCPLFSLFASSYMFERECWERQPCWSKLTTRWHWPPGGTDLCELTWVVFGYCLSLSSLVSYHSNDVDLFLCHVISILVSLLFTLSGIYRYNYCEYSDNYIYSLVHISSIYVHVFINDILCWHTEASYSLSLYIINRLWAQYHTPVIKHIQDEFNARCQPYCQI